MNITAPMLKPLRQKALLTIYLQLIVILVFAMIWFFIKGLSGSVSAILGGIAWTIPNFYFIRKIFKASNGRTLHDVAKDFYLGEVIKLLMSGILIVLFVKMFAIVLPPFLSTYIGVVMTSFFMPFFCNYSAN
jgi:ATP synthase protein I